MFLRRWKVSIPHNRLSKSFSRGSGNGGQNLHASHSRCLIRFNLTRDDWLPSPVRDAFLQLYGNYVSARGTVVIVREDSRSAADNEKLAMEQLQKMLDKAEQLSSVLASANPPAAAYATDQERIKATRSESQIQRYKDRMLMGKKLKSEVKRNRARRDDW